MKDIYNPNTVKQYPSVYTNATENIINNNHSSNKDKLSISGITKTKLNDKQIENTEWTMVGTQFEQKSSIIYDAQKLIAKDINPQMRRNEFKQYLQLFGYNPEKTILQVYIAGYFRKRQASQRELEKRNIAAKRYGGSTFVIVGRTHDPSIIENLIEPKKRNPYERNAGYLGYLWKNKDRYDRAPHEILPLDFTPVHIQYPDQWKTIFPTKGYMIAMHVPSSFVKKKNELTKYLYKVGKHDKANVKKDWSFISEIQLSINPSRAKATKARKDGKR